MKDFLKEYFIFSNRERRGLIVLLIIISILIAANILVNYQINKRPIDFSDFEKNIDAWYAADSGTSHIETSLFYFDPNTANRETLIALGIKDYVADNIISYRTKGGKFRDSNDLSRIYGLSPDCFERIKPYIRIETKSNKPQTPNWQKEQQNTIQLQEFDPNTADKNTLISLGFKPWVADNLIKYRNQGAVFKQKEDILKLYGIDSSFYNEIERYITIQDSFINHNSLIDTLLIDINTADALQLTQLRGIGPSYSERIIVYRDKLGGFTTVNQLYEVYGLKAETIEQIRNQIIINPTAINCININTADFTTLIKHPYLDKPEVQAILNYRAIIGNFTDKTQLRSEKVITPEVYQKISPYICTE